MLKLLVIFEPEVRCPQLKYIPVKRLFYIDRMVGTLELHVLGLSILAMRDTSLKKLETREFNPL